MDALLGALIGVFGALIVALVTYWLNEQRRGSDAARAVFYELQVIRSVVRTSAVLRVVLPHPMERQAWDATLPRLAGFLSPREFHHVLISYHDATAKGILYPPGHSLDDNEVRLFERTASTMTTAIDLLARRGFKKGEKGEYVRVMADHNREQEDILRSRGSDGVQK